jgi:hypothetical protein
VELRRLLLLCVALAVAEFGRSPHPGPDRSPALPPVTYTAASLVSTPTLAKESPLAPPTPALESATAEGRAVTYPVPNGVRTSEDWEVRANGLPVFVYATRVKRGGPASVASFDFSGKVDLEFTCHDQIPRAVAIRPRSLGIKPTVEGQKIRVSLDRPCRFTVEVGGDEASPSQIEGQVRSLYVFANPVETDKPDADAPNILYFGPGLHQPGTIEVKTGQTLYLAGGAVVHARVIGWEANDVTICGRGILHLGHVPVPTVIVPGQVFPAMLALTRCHGLRMEGITLLDAAVWTVVLKECSDVRISNIKIVNGRYYSTDGINPVNCQDVAIEDCFFRCTDDNISVKGLNWGLPSRNILVERCTFWSDNNNAIVVGPESKCSLLENVTFRNCDILYVHDNQEIKAAMSVIQLDDTSMTNVTFEDIRVERAQGRLVNIFFTHELFNIPGECKAGGHEETYGHAEDFAFVTGKLFRKRCAGDCGEE